MGDPAEKGTLPDGWIVKVSKSFPDRVYYFNLNTGSSTWECPKLNPPGTSKTKLSQSLNTSNKPASNQHAINLHDTKSPELIKPYRIAKILSDAKKESQKRSAENETPSGSSLNSKLSNPPTAVVAPVVLDKTVAPAKKKKKKKSKKKASAESVVAVHTSDGPSATILQSGSLKKVSFPIKSNIRTITTKSECEILPKSIKLTPEFKKKQSIVIPVPTAAKQSGASTRCATLDKKVVLHSSTSKGPSLHERFSSLKSRAKPSASTVCKVEKQLPNETQLNENKKRVFYEHEKSGADLSFSTTKPSYDSDCEISDMDCEMNSDFEELTVTVEPAGINVGASTSHNDEPDWFDDIEMLDTQEIRKWFDSSHDSDGSVAALEKSSPVKKKKKIENDQEKPMETAAINIGASTSRNDEPDWLDIEKLNKESYFLIVDTNVFISELKYIAEMKDTPVKGCGPPHFVIPWVVLQELDNLKKHGARPKHRASKETITKKNNELKRSAAEAIRFLNALLKAKHPRFHFQHPDEEKKCQKDFSRINDDKLLECCLKLQERMPKERVILLTNDRNLENKAMVMNIVVHDRNSLSTILKSDFTINENPKVISNPTYVPEPFKVLAEQKSLEQMHRANYDKYEMEIHAHLSKARELLKDVLDPLFEREMDETYGDAWHSFPVERHILNGILDGMMRYWGTVFTFLFSVEDKAKFEILQEQSKRPEGFLGERSECLNIFKIIIELFIVIKIKWTSIHVPLEEIQKVKTMTEGAFSNLSECEKFLNSIEIAIRQAEISCCIEVFNHNWTVIKRFCGSSLEFCGIPHKLVYDKSAPLPSLAEIHCSMPGLLSSLDQLKNTMKRMLAVVKSSTPDTSVFKELHKMLMELVPSLKIETENISFNHFSAKLVEIFCRLPENRQKIEEYLDDLLSNHENLEKAATVLKKMI